MLFSSGLFVAATDEDVASDSNSLPACFVAEVPAVIMCLRACAEFDASGLPPLCKHPKTRAAAVELLHSLAAKSPAILCHLLKLASQLCHIPARITEPGAKVSATAWNLVETPGRGSSDFVGLRNLGCTCYMNATLQQLFNIPSLRAVIRRAHVVVSHLLCC